MFKILIKIKEWEILGVFLVSRQCEEIWFLEDQRKEADDDERVSE